ncbi:g4728 [Coccomyxa viridis]|uniref:G4728 protein n=1 Tax=Coccomyxa viridis TaxID=1274662 RepID=A0ABP1FT97_9CHLO
MSPPCCEATLLDARDALETCSILDESSKKACYAQFGCDGQRVERYFNAVEHLENAWQQEEEETDDDEYVDHSKSDWPWQVFH